MPFCSKVTLFRRVPPPLIPVKIEITFIAAPSYRAFSLKGDAAHISVYSIIAQTEGSCQFFAVQHLTIFHIGALQDIDPVMPAVEFDLLESKARLSAERSSDHLMKNLKEKRPDKRNLRCHMQSLAIRLYTYSYGFLYQSYGLFAWDIFNHLQIDSRPRENHPFGMQFFLFGKLSIFLA